MGLTRVVCLVLLVVIVLSTTTNTLAQTTSTESSDYYPLAVGNSWTYQATVSGLGNSIQGEMKIEITGTRSIAGSDCYVMQGSFEGNVTTEQCMGWQGNQLIIYQETSNGQDIQLTPPQIVLETPLEVGHQWTWSGTALNPATSETAKVTTTTEVSGQSTITVPAGTYSAYTVTTQVNTESTYGGISTPSASSTEKLWLVQGIGDVKEDDTFSSEGNVVTMSGELTQYYLATTPNYPAYLCLTVAGVTAIALVIFLLRRRRKTSTFNAQQGKTPPPQTFTHTQRRICPIHKYGMSYDTSKNRHICPKCEANHTGTEREEMRRTDDRTTIAPYTTDEERDWHKYERDRKTAIEPYATNEATRKELENKWREEFLKRERARVGYTTQQEGPLKSETKFCRECGAKIPRDSIFCEECGTKLA